MSAPTHKGEHDAASGHCGHDHPSSPNEHGTIVRDPVCGMNVDSRTAAHKLRLGETDYYFCSAGCLEKFKANPDRYLNPPARDPAVQSPAMGALPQAAEGTIWTCPMHPEIRRNGPGNARSAEWRWNRSSLHWTRAPIPS